MLQAVPGKWALIQAKGEEPPLRLAAAYCQSATELFVLGGERGQMGGLGVSTMSESSAQRMLSEAPQELQALLQVTCCSQLQGLPCPVAGSRWVQTGSADRVRCLPGAVQTGGRPPRGSADVPAILPQPAAGHVVRPMPAPPDHAQAHYWPLSPTPARRSHRTAAVRMSLAPAYGKRVPLPPPKGSWTCRACDGAS